VPKLTLAVQPSEKPLPSRPCASLAHTLSPRKDSRTLMDASEKPLQQSVDGKLCEWTAMLPHSASGVALEASDVNMAELLRSTPPFTASPENIFSPDRWIARVPNTLVNTSLAASGDGATESDASERSSSSTFLSADDGNVRGFTNSDSTPASNALGGYTAGVKQHSSDNSTESKNCDDSPYRSDRLTEHPPRNASLKAQYGHGFVIAPILSRNFQRSFWVSCVQSQILDRTRRPQQAFPGHGQAAYLTGEASPRRAPRWRKLPRFCGRRRLHHEYPSRIQRRPCW